MAYSGIEDIRNLIRWTSFNTSTTVDTEQIASIREEVDAEIDSRLNAYYDVPVEEEPDILILRYISSRKTAYEIAKILISQAGGELPEVVREWNVNAEERLQKIINGELELPNTESSEAIKDLSAGLYSEQANKDPFWKKGKEQW